MPAIGLNPVRASTLCGFGHNTFNLQVRSSHALLHPWPDRSRHRRLKWDSYPHLTLTVLRKVEFLKGLCLIALHDQFFCRCRWACIYSLDIVDFSAASLCDFTMISVWWCLAVLDKVLFLKLVVHAIVMSFARLVLLMLLGDDQLVFVTRRVEIVLFGVVDLVYHKLR